MVTSDSVETAKAIAFECGILNSSADSTEANIIEGKVFRELLDTEREEIAEKILVLLNCYNNLLFALLIMHNV